MVPRSRWVGKDVGVRNPVALHEVEARAPDQLGGLDPIASRTIRSNQGVCTYVPALCFSGKRGSRVRGIRSLISNFVIVWTLCYICFGQ